MQEVLAALANALKSLFRPKMLSLVLWPMTLAIALWGAAALLFWHDWAAALSHAVGQSGAQAYLADVGAVWLSHFLITALLILLLVPLVYISALLITAIFAMPLMVGWVAQNNYPQLEKRRGGTMAGSVWNGVAAVLIFSLAWLLTLPLWLFPMVAWLIPLLLSAYLNQRLFRYDALADHASHEEYRQILERAGGRLFLLGGLLALIQYVPVLNFFAPIYIGLAFIHLCLGELSKLRAEGGADPEPAG